MNLTLHMTKRQMLLFVLVFLALLATALLVIHAAMPDIWRVITLSPDVVNKRP